MEEERKAYSRLDTVLYGWLAQNTWPLQMQHANLTGESCHSRKKPERDTAGCFCLLYVQLSPFLYFQHKGTDPLHSQNTSIFFFKVVIILRILIEH